MLYTICTNRKSLSSIVAYFGNSTVCTIAVYVTLVPRQLEELTMDLVSPFTQSVLVVHWNDQQFRNCSSL